ncbi:BON domain-containing protein [Paraburkholderia strydomiana]|uniref:BON domain-containing protein n=1 Tax=Paraburkholderia strydomiana TaxID=1245417 RepID=UPI00285496BF|nr:BON domain-containing protein [Paraburkholderia strydomiana]MDR7009636.1 osmotically-inducible protein OsmY [Paraburkholderia strydomiana]
MKATKLKSLTLAPLIVLFSCYLHAVEKNVSDAAPGMSSALVVKDKTLTDQQLRASVKSALKSARQHGLKSTYLRVRVTHGVVTLTGVVRDPQQIDLAKQAASGVKGVTDVRSKLVVRNVAPLKDNQ